MYVKISDISHPILDKSGIKLSMLRLDKIDAAVTGNKHFKLKYNLKEARKLGFTKLLTFGGAYSNHIAAVAEAGNEYMFQTIGIIRGEKHEELNPTLQTASDNGMYLKYISREEYRKKNNPEYVNSLMESIGACYVIPEGGTNDLAIKGAMEISDFIPEDYDVVCCAIGTGGTLAGLITSQSHAHYIGYSSLKGDFVEGMIRELIKVKSVGNWSVNGSYHWGGYAKHDEKLLNFIRDFKELNNIQLDQVYTGKMMYGILDQISRGEFKPKSRIMAIHTGGLQGLLPELRNRLA